MPRAARRWKAPSAAASWTSAAACRIPRKRASARSRKAPRAERPAASAADAALESTWTGWREPARFVSFGASALTVAIHGRGWVNSRMRKRPEPLPAEFLNHLGTLEAAYLSSDDPLRQSGFGGGPARWRAERSPILDAIGGSGTLLDVGCANGYLLESLVSWGSERGLALTPFGVDRSAR